MSAALSYPDNVTPVSRDAVIRLPYTQQVSTIEASRVQFRWGSRLADGKISLLDGDPGLGKSTLTLEIAARYTRGEALPGGEQLEPSCVLILSAEDGEADTIRPRLDVAGADLTKVMIFKMQDTHGNYSPAIIPDDIDALEHSVQSTRARLIVIDPLMAFLSGEKNANRDQDVRQALAPLSSMAERNDCAVLILRHLNKAAGTSAIYRGGGSIGITGAARFAMVVGKHPEDPTGKKRILMSVKNNLGPEPKALAYHLVGVEGTDVAKVEWLGEVDMSTQKLLESEKTDYERTVLREARNWLQDQLSEGAVVVRDLQSNAKRDGLYWRNVEGAKAELGVVSHREGFGKGGHYVWRFPLTLNRQDQPKQAEGEMRQGTVQPIDGSDTWPS